MTQLEKIVKYQLVENVWGVYHQNDVPVQIRMIQTKRFGPKWLEVSVNQVQSNANIDYSRDPQVEQFKTKFFQELRFAIQQTIAQARLTQDIESLVQTLDLQERVDTLELRYSNASGLFMVIKQCLEAEMNLILQKEQDMTFALPPVIPVQPQAFPPPQHDDFNIESQILDVKRTSEGLQNTIAIQNRERFPDLHGRLDGDGSKGILPIFKYLHKNTHLIELSKQVDKILDWLKSWMVEQRNDKRRALNGASAIVNLDLESASLLTNKVAKGVFDLYKIIKPYNGNQIVEATLLDALVQLYNWIRDRTRTLIMGAFIIQQQPKQILLMNRKVSKKKSEASVKIRFLVGPTFQSSGAPVEVSLIGNLKQSKFIKTRSGGYLPKIAIKLTQNSKRDLDTNTYIADFKEIVMPIKRTVSSVNPEKTGKKKPPNSNKIDKVPQRKYYFHFRSKFSCPELDLQELDISTTSVPVIVNTHTKWKADSWATITWDNIQPDPLPGDVEIDTNKLTEVFSNILRKDTGKELSTSTQNLCSTLPTDKVTWQMFFMQPIYQCLRPAKLISQNDSPDNEDDWLYEIKQLCTPSSINKTGIPKFWKEGKIEGFICEDTLTQELQKTQGAFALYFSEALHGGLTVACYSFEKQCLERLSPFTPSTFVENNELERRLHDQDQLQYLYPTGQLTRIAFPFAEHDADAEYTKNTYNVYNFKCLGMTPMQKKLAHVGYTPHCSQLRHMMS